MVRVEEFGSAVIAEYYYDPFGRRLWKEVDGVRTYFLYSDEGLIGEYDAAGGEIKAYGWKPGSTWGTDPLFMKVVTEYYFYHNDHLGTPKKITTVNGGVIWSASYTSFLKANLSPSCSITNNLRAPGQYFDQETGLHYNYHRYYDPVLGRYLKADPIGLKDGVNLYAYSRLNPIRFVDPYGLYCKIEFDEPVAAGDPVGWRYEEEKIGYWEAVAKRLAWEYTVAILKKLPPIPSPAFEYILRKTTYGIYYLYVYYWEVCYDDCTGEETSRTPLGRGKIDRTTEVVVDQTEERKYL